MKISVKTLKGTHFDVDANPEDTVADVKKSIESLQRQSAYPAEQQVLIHQGKILKDDTTLQDNNVSENSFLVIMLRKAKGSSSGASTASDKPTIQVSPANSETPTPAPAPTAAPAATVALRVPIPSATITSDSGATVPNEVDAYGQAASNHVTGSNLEQTIQNLLHMGGGTWDRATVVRALRSAYNNPERAVDLLNSGIREQEETPIVVPAAITEQRVGTPVEAPQTAQPAVPSSGPNAIPLNLFPQQGSPSTGINIGVGRLDFLHNRSKFRALQALVQANPQVLQPMRKKLGKQIPRVMRLIRKHQAEFLRLINERAEGEERNLLGQLADAMPQALPVTPEEREAIEQGIPSTGINTGVGRLDFLRNSSQFRALQALVQANPQLLQPMLQELGKQNPHVMRLIQEHQAEFLRLINGPAEREERNLQADAMPQALTVTHEEREAIERVFFACNRNEELTTNYLLDHLHEFEDDQ